LCENVTLDFDETLKCIYA